MNFDTPSFHEQEYTHANVTFQQAGVLYCVRAFIRRTSNSCVSIYIIFGNNILVDLVFFNVNIFI